MTLEGSFTVRTFAKEAGLTIGRVTRGALTSCTGGVARLNAETLPWTVTYRSFGGTLPTITWIVQDIVNMNYEVHPEGIPQCRFRTEVNRPMRGISTVSSGESLTLRAEEASLIGGIPGSGLFCEFASDRIIGTAAATVLGETAHVRIVLI